MARSLVYRFVSSRVASRSRRDVSESTARRSSARVVWAVHGAVAVRARKPTAQPSVWVGRRGPASRGAPVLAGDAAQSRADPSAETGPYRHPRTGPTPARAQTARPSGRRGGGGSAEREPKTRVPMATRESLRLGWRLSCIVRAWPLDLLDPISDRMRASDNYIRRVVTYTPYLVACVPHRCGCLAFCFSFFERILRFLTFFFFFSPAGAL